MSFEVINCGPNASMSIIISGVFHRPLTFIIGGRDIVPLAVTTKTLTIESKKMYTQGVPISVTGVAQASVLVVKL